ncbi:MULTISPECIES: sugar phosphate isomerase/epimerase [unclassified Streptococcus]|uniref:sugar phosphate isomerase/epimerase family protein n=1 Tax=unclassified Streptococcus TaxID=2608887 RepID=UPI001071C41E|nr:MULTISPECIES: TIM barrel protein [unclassified Streptococcus]MBF0806135.1 TIM barrel protein [Streptococcus sp. 19428wA2_WM07]TFU28292.1 AP endonuclease [Streptococcus sp. WM07]
MKRQEIILNTIAFQAQLDQGYRQVDLLPWVQKLGVQRLEIRSDFLTGELNELHEIRREADKLGIALYYSANVDFLQGDFVNPDIVRHCQVAEILGAPFLKLNIGDGSAISEEQLVMWAKTFPSDMNLRIENNQDPDAATISNCQKVMGLLRRLDLPISFVFDTGNWAFVGESTVEAAEILGDLTSYLHCKNFRNQDGVLRVASFFEGELDLVQLLSYFPSLEYLALEYPASVEQLEVDLARLENIG